MRWNDRCPFVIKAIIPSIFGAAERVIDRCVWERGHTEPHWSKDHGELEKWVNSEEPK